MLRTRSLFFCLAGAAIPLVLWAGETVDLFAVNRIRAEAFSNSKVMDTMFYLADVYGPRLTNSPNFKAAGDWAVKRLQEFGLTNVKEEKWGPFGKGWEAKYYEGHMVEPRYYSLNGIPLAWTEGTNGSVTGEAMVAPLRTEADMEKYKGKLKGKIVLTSEPRELALPTAPDGRRYNEAELAEMAAAPEPGRSPFAFVPPQPTRGPAGQNGAPTSREERRKLQEKIRQFLRDEGALLTLTESPNGQGDTIFAAAGGSYDPKSPNALASVAMMPEQYNRIARLVEHNVPVKLEFNIQNEFHDDSPDTFNIIGEIPGTGPHKDELVMLGGHFDSWQGGTGATDNGAGSGVMMEAVRILKATQLPMDRTGFRCEIGSHGLIG